VGATERQRLTITATGVSLDECHEWLALGYELNSVERSHNAGLSIVRSNLAQGFDRWISVLMAEVGVSPETMNAYRALGCDETWMLAAFERPRRGEAQGIDRLREYLNDGWTVYDAALWAQHGLSPA
jgi:hypothetical protein